MKTIQLTFSAPRWYNERMKCVAHCGEGVLELWAILGGEYLDAEGYGRVSHAQSFCIYSSCQVGVVEVLFYATTALTCYGRIIRGHWI